MLSQKTILSIVHSQDGTLWIGTLAGVDRYNGSEFSKYRPNFTQEGHIKSSSIVEIIETTTGGIFVATPDAGLLIYDEDSDRFLTESWITEAKLPESRMSTAYASKDGSIWVGFESGDVARFSPDSRQVTSIQLDLGERIAGISQTPQGNILAASASGSIFELQDNLADFHQIGVKNSCLDNFSELDEIASIADHLLWLGTRDNGLLLLDMDTGMCTRPHSTLLTGKKISKADIHEIHFDSHSASTWVATDQGLYNIDSRLKVTRFGTDNSNLSNDEVSSIAQGSDGLYWVGTYTGLNYIVPTIFETYDKGTHYGLSSIVAIDSLDGLGSWIASYNGLIFHNFIDKIHREMSEKKPNWNIINEKIMSLEVSDNGIWIGYRAAGLQFVSFDENQETVFSWRAGDSGGLTSDSVSAILLSEDGRTLVGTFGGGLNIVSINNDTETYSIGNNRVIMLYQTTDKTYWIGTESGLFSFDIVSKNIEQIHLNREEISGRINPIVWDMVETPEGELWLATMHHGLFVWNRKESGQERITPFYTPISAGASFNIVYAMELDNHGSIWASTDNGLVRIDPLTRKVDLFSQQHGLQLSEFDFGVSHKDLNGYLYFGGSNGYTRFDPALIETAQNIPSMLITKILLPNSLNNTLSYLNQIRAIQLTHKDYFIQFDFSVLDFLDPEKNQYRYMLEGFDHDWIENGTRNSATGTRNSATYTSLPPGDYTLRVQGANSAGVWNREGLSLHIEVLPPPWRSWWAYTIYALILTLLGWLAMRAYNSYVVGRLARTLAAEMVESQQRADDEMQEQLEIHDDLVKSVYQHSISTLNLVSEFIAIKGSHLGDESARELTLANVDRVEALALLEECLYYQNEILLADMNKYTNIITSRLLRHAPGGQESISTINEVSAQPLPIQLASPLAIVIYELLENAIQHAFDSAGGANYIQISLGPESSDDSYYRFSIQDNGAGIPPNIDPMSAQTSGLAVVAAMNARLGGELAFTTGTGTLVTITFPRDLT